LVSFHKNKSLHFVAERKKKRLKIQEASVNSHETSESFVCGKKPKISYAYVFSIWS